MNSEALLRRASRVAGLAVRAGSALGRRLPGAHAAQAGMRSFERKAIEQLRNRLDPAAAYPATVAISTPKALLTDSTSSAGTRATHPLRAGMAELLRRSTASDVDAATEQLYALILRQLAPDEARVVSLLATGSAYPVIDVVERTGIGAARVVLCNASTVGKAAGVSLPDHVPAYVTRIVALGLALLGPEDATLSTEYEILLTDDTVRDAQRGLSRPRFVRRSVRVSSLGVRFWAACDPGDGWRYLTENPASTGNITPVT
nr:Abi-alpha family protein [Saccharomonospora marina]